MEAELLQSVQETKQKELECRYQLEQEKMNSEKAKLQQKIVKAQMEEGETLDAKHLAYVSSLRDKQTKSTTIQANPCVVGSKTGGENIKNQQDPKQELIPIVKSPPIAHVPA